MKLPAIKSVRALQSHHVEMIWSAGRLDQIDPGAALKAHASLAPVPNKARFAEVAPDESGHALSWVGTAH